MDTNKAKKHEFFLIVRADTIKASADGIRLSADAIKIFSKGFFSPRKGTTKAKTHEIYFFYLIKLSDKSDNSDQSDNHTLP